MTTQGETIGIEPELMARADMTPTVGEYALSITGLGQFTGLPLRHARFRLTRHADSARDRPITGEATAEFDGRRVRAQVAASTEDEAIDLLADVLRHRMSRLARRWEARGEAALTAPHEWRHSAEISHQPEYSSRPEKDRKIIRHKTFELALATPDEAIEDLELMGYRFQLFTDLETGQDSVVYRSGPTGYRLAQLRPATSRTWRATAPLTTSPDPAPRLDLAEVIERLNLTEWPFLFYANPITGRGRALYRRYDGHYGLITPVGA